MTWPTSIPTRLDGIRRFRRLPAIGAVLCLLLWGPTTVAHNWGPDPTNPSTYYCSTSYDSECAADNSIHAVWYAANLTSALRTAFSASLADDYTFSTEFFAYMTTNYASADAAVLMTDSPNNWPAAYTACDVAQLPGDRATTNGASHR